MRGRQNSQTLNQEVIDRAFMATKIDLLDDQSSKIKKAAVK